MCHNYGGGKGFRKGKGRYRRQGGREKSLESRDESRRGRGWKKVRRKERGGGRGVIIQPQQVLLEPQGHAGSKRWGAEE